MGPNEVGIAVGIVIECGRDSGRDSSRNSHNLLYFHISLLRFKVVLGQNLLFGEVWYNWILGQFYLKRDESCGANEVKSQLKILFISVAYGHRRVASFAGVACERKRSLSSARVRAFARCPRSLAGSVGTLPPSWVGGSCCVA